MQLRVVRVRGLAHHHGSEVRAPVFRVPEMDVGGREVWKAYPGGREASACCSCGRPCPRCQPSTEKMHDRDAYYARHVEGRGLREPLVAAQRFLAGLQ